MPVIPSYTEAEIRRLMVPGQPGQKMNKALSQWKKRGVVVSTRHPSDDSRKYKIGLRYLDPTSKITRATKGWRHGLGNAKPCVHTPDPPHTLQ
jgi:hypothetical protein